MNGKQARKIRRAVYGEDRSPRARDYIGRRLGLVQRIKAMVKGSKDQLKIMTPDTGRADAFRRLYQDTKRAWRCRTA